MIFLNEEELDFWIKEFKKVLEDNKLNIECLNAIGDIEVTKELIGANLKLDKVNTDIEINKKLINSILQISKIWIFEDRYLTSIFKNEYKSVLEKIMKMGNQKGVLNNDRKKR